MITSKTTQAMTQPSSLDEQQWQLIQEWNNTHCDYPQKCLHHLFEEQATQTPDKTALVFEKKQLSYRELNERANQLAHHLSRLGVGQETMVALCTERSLEMFIGLLGILKAGGAYVPLDPSASKAFSINKESEPFSCLRILVILLNSFTNIS